jgi:hypothetical protein
MIKILKIIYMTIKIIFFIFGGFSILWALFCFLGGPEGDPGRGFPFGVIFLIIAYLFIIAGKRIGEIGKGKKEKIVQFNPPGDL